MKCPYNKKVVCAYLEDMQIYHCPDCPNYNPIHEDKPEGKLFTILILLGIIGSILGLMYIVGQFFLL
jgi:hypothetical protein